MLQSSGTSPDILGILNRSGLATPIAMGTDSGADAIARQISAIQIATSIRPDGIVLHPANWLTILISKTEGGEYLGANPFAGPQLPMLWGLPVAVMPAITAGTALVGAFKTAAMLLRRGGLRVDVSNSHSDFLVKNLVAIRAELREALIVTRSAAFGVVTGLD